MSCPVRQAGPLGEGKGHSAPPHPGPGVSLTPSPSFPAISVATAASSPRPETVGTQETHDELRKERPTALQWFLPKGGKGTLRMGESGEKE